MAKKKTNPNKIPISPDSFDINEITEDATNTMVLRGWALVLGALANFGETTTENLFHLWKEVNAYSTSIKGYSDVADSLKYIEKIAGISIPFERVYAGNIKTQGDLDKFKRRTYQNALYSAFAIIAEPIIAQKLVCEEDIPLIFQKAYDLDDDIIRGRITLEDIQDMLRDEYSIDLYDEGGRVQLRRLST